MKDNRGNSNRSNRRGCNVLREFKLIQITYLDKYFYKKKNIQTFVTNTVIYTAGLKSTVRIWSILFNMNVITIN